MFFTSSEDESKKHGEYQFDGEGIIMGTGGNATLHYYNGRFAVSTDCVVLLPDDRLRCKYLYYFFLANISLLEAGFKGAGLKHTNKGYIGNIDIEIPSLDEQDCIVNALDRVFEVRHSRIKELSLLDNLIKARFVEMFGNPRTNPNGYKVEELRSSCTVLTGNTPSRSVEEYYGDFIEWIKTDNIVSGRTSPIHAVEGLSEKGMKVGRTVDENVILMACIAGSIASIGRVCITDRKVAFNQQINAIIPKNYDVRFLYVLLQLSKDYLVEEINMALKGILSKSKLEDKVFYVPPLELQEQFSIFVAQVDKSKFVGMRSVYYEPCFYNAKMI